MRNKLIFGGIWLFFTVYAFVFAPPSQPETLELITKLATAQIAGINPLVVALFNLMGVLPLVYACLLLVDGRGQKIAAWKLLLPSFGVGAFALLPYLALRKKNPYWIGKLDRVLRVLESPLTAILLGVTVLSLIFWGINSGDWSNFVQQWHNSKFIHVMSLDFCLLCLLLPMLVKDDLVRRGIDNIALWNTIAFVPLLGTLVYLCLRPPLPVDES